MPKLKTKKSVAKRFRLTKKGKLKYSPGGKSHLLSGKEPERLRHLRKASIIEGKKDRKYIKRMLPLTRKIQNYMSSYSCQGSAH